MHHKLVKVIFQRTIRLLYKWLAKIYQGFLTAGVIINPFDRLFGNEA